MRPIICGALLVGCMIGLASALAVAGDPNWPPPGKNLPGYDPYIDALKQSPRWPYPRTSPPGQPAPTAPASGQPTAPTPGQPAAPAAGQPPATPATPPTPGTPPTPTTPPPAPSPPTPTPPETAPEPAPAPPLPPTVVPAAPPPAPEPTAAATAPPTPAPAPAAAASALATFNAAALAAPSFAADESDVMTKLVVQGDQAPFSLLRAAQVPGTPPRPPVPPVPPVPHPGQAKAGILLPWARGFKIADNQSPRPQDRFFFTFNYFDNLNADVNRRLGGTFQNVKIYREMFGYEKTFLDGNASLGLRVPVNSITADSPVRGLGETRTSFGNLTGFGKYVLWKDATAANLISTGLAVTVPNSPTAFAGAPYAVGFREVNIQPFVGYFFSSGRAYVQGFESIDVPTVSRDVTMLYNDVAVGYFLYKSEERRPFLRAIAPTFEAHINVPLNHQGIVRIGDPAATYPVVDLTLGLNFFLRDSSALSVALVEPVTGPRPFNYELTILYNFYFGRTRANRLTTPGTLGN